MVNKQDLPLAASPEEIAVAFQAAGHLQGRNWRIVGTSAKNGTGIFELLESLHSICKPKE